MGLSVQKGLIFQFLKKKWLRKKWFETKIWHLKGKKLFHVSPYLLVKVKNNLHEKSKSPLAFYRKICVREGEKLLSGSKIIIFWKKKIFSKTTYMSWLKIGSIGPLNVWKKWSKFGVIYSSSFGQNFFFPKKKGAKFAILIAKKKNFSMISLEKFFDFEILYFWPQIWIPWLILI